MKKQSIFLSFYLIIALIYFYADFQGNLQLTYLSKPLLITSLLIYFYLSVKNNLSSFSKYILIALVFSIAGDTFLMFVDEQGAQPYFIFGLGSFLLTHVFYIIAFIKLPTATSHGFLKQKPFWAIPLLIIFVGMVYYLWPDLPESLQIPVAIYSFAIMSMGLAALNLKTQIPSVIFTLIMIGAIAFIFSDSMIALNKFKSHQLSLPEPRLLIMVPYLVGQYLIVKGSVLANEYIRKLHDLEVK